MVRQASELSDDKVESTVDKFRTALMVWIEQKKTGKISFEVNTGQGGVNKCVVKTELQI